jgi:hypothetical protein
VSGWILKIDQRPFFFLDFQYRKNPSPAMAQPRSRRVLGSGAGVADSVANEEDRGIIDINTAVVKILFIIAALSFVIRLSLMQFPPSLP